MSLAACDDDAPEATPRSTVLTIGGHGYGRLGAESIPFFESTPTPVLGLTEVTSISAGWYFGVARVSDGTLRTWGDNYSGQLGDGTILDQVVPTPVAEVTNAKAIGAGNDHTVIVLE